MHTVISLTSRNPHFSPPAIGSAVSFVIIHCSIDDGVSLLVRGTNVACVISQESMPPLFSDDVSGIPTI